MTRSEFAVDLLWKSDLSGPGRWIWSHLKRSPWLLIVLVTGALGNAALAAAIGLNEAETLLSIEPFDFTVRHLDLEKTRVPPCAIARRAELRKG